jgi:hypothetical protein
MVDARQLDIILKIAADRQSANQAAQVVDKMDDDLASVGKTADIASQKLANISRNARLDKIGETFGNMARKIKDTDKAAAELQKRLEQIGATQPEIERATDAFSRTASADSGAHLSEGLSRAGAKARFLLPAINVGGVSSEAISKVVQVLGALPPVALPVIGVVAALGAGFVALESSLSGVKKQLGDAINANKTYYQLLADGTTTDEAKKRLKDLQREQTAAQQELASITTAQSQAFKDAAKTYGDAGARLLFGLGNVSTADDELAKRQDELTKSIASNSTEQEGLNRALQDGSLASADYKKHLEEETKIKSDAALAGANDEYNKQLKLQQEGLMSSSQLMGKITDAEQQQFAAQAALNKLQADKARGIGGEDVDKQIRDFQLQLGRTGADITRLYGEFADRKGIEDAIQHEKDLAAARKEVDKVNNDVNKAREKEAADLTAIADKYRESANNLKKSFDSANLEAEIDRQQKIADLQKDTRDKEAEAQTKFNDEKVKIEEDYRKRVKEIERDFTRSSAQAIQDRDAVALDAAKTKRKDELDDAKEQRQSSLNERQKEYNAEMRQLRKSNDDKIAQINLNYQREYEQRQRKYNSDLQALYDNSARDRAARVSAYEKQLADLRTNLQQNTDLWAAAGQTIVNYVKNVKDSINNLIGGGVSAVGNAVVSPSSTAPIISFAGGGTLTRDGWVQGHAGEVILNRKQQQGLGGVNLSINGMGLTRKSLEREVINKLSEYWDAYDRA